MTQSAAGYVQGAFDKASNTISKLTGGKFSGDLDRDLGINALPHNAAREEQDKLNKQAAELAAQQRADAANTPAGPQAIGLRPQYLGDSTTASGIADSESTPGTSLYRRPRGAARRSITGY